MTRAILFLALLTASAASADSGKLFVQSAVEHPDVTVTLPLYRGTSQGHTVWYILLDSSDGADAQAKGLNRSQKLANAAGTAAVQKVSVSGGVINFPGTASSRTRRRSPMTAAGRRRSPPSTSFDSLSRCRRRRVSRAATRSNTFPLNPRALSAPRWRT